MFLSISFVADSICAAGMSGMCAFLAACSTAFAPNNAAVISQITIVQKAVFQPN